jgi:hypothetical protein
MHSRETFKGNPKGMRKYTTEGTRIKRLWGKNVLALSKRAKLVWMKYGKAEGVRRDDTIL